MPVAGTRVGDVRNRSADAEVIPLVEFGVYLERGFGFLSQR